MSEVFPKITIVTAAFNQEAYIEDCITSVLDQGYPNLEYIIIDGASTDRTLQVIKKYEKHLAFLVSEKDKGLYDALNKGFRLSTGEIMGWINSDDFAMRNSLYTLADVFSNNPEVAWLQGHPCVADESGRIVYQRAPRSSRWSFLSGDYHDGIFIQQESTYWRRSLWVTSGSQVSQRYRFAGDFELWMRFFNSADLFSTDAIIGCFRLRKEQMSAKNYEAYLKECDEIVALQLAKLSEIERRHLDNYRFDRSGNSVTRMLRRLRGVNGAIRNESDLNADRTVNFDKNIDRFVIQ